MAELTIEEAAHEIVSSAVDQRGDLPLHTRFSVHAPTDRYRVPIAHSKYMYLRGLVEEECLNKDVELVATAGPTFTFVVTARHPVLT